MRSIFLNKSLPGKFKWLLVGLGWLWLHQAVYAQVATPITLQQAVDTALTRHPEVRNAQLFITEAQALQKTAIELPTLQFGLNRGQINSELVDNFWSINQNFTAPFSYSPTRRMFSERTKLRQEELAVAQNRLVLQVKSVYLQWLLLFEKRKILQAQDSIYREFTRAASLKYQAGETNKLSSIVALTQSQQVENELFQLNADIEIQQNRLMQLLNTEQVLVPQETGIVKLQLPGVESLTAVNAPLLRLLRQQVVVQQHNTRVERSKLSPDFSLGYFNQQLDHVSGFQGIQIGVAIPVWIAPYRNRIYASKLQEQVVSNQLAYQQFNLARELDILVREYRKYENTLAYFEKNALRQADLIAENTLKSYRAGEIEYVEFVRNMTEVYQLRLAYIEAVNNYNQSIIRIQSVSSHQ